MDCSPLGFFIHGILQARVLEWVAMPFSKGASWARDRTQVPCISWIGGFFTTSTTWEALIVTEETLIQMRANLSLLHLQYIKTNKQTNKKPHVNLARAWEQLLSDLLMGMQTQIFLDRVW